VTLGSQTLTISNGSTTYTGIIQGTGGLTLSGGTQTLSGANTYTGATTINGGTLQAGANTALAQTSAYTVASGATLALNNFNETIGSLAGAGTVTNGGGNSRTLTVGDTSSTTFSGVMQNGAAGAFNLTKQGSGTLTLSGTNTFTGVTTINAGTLALSASGSVATSSQVNVANAAGTFDISNTSAGATITTLNGVANSNVTLGSQTLTLSNGSTTYAGIIQGAGGLTLTAGTQTLSGTNTYTGDTTINGGTLALSGAAGSIATSSQVNIANAAGTFSIAGNTAGAVITTLNGVANSHVTLGTQTLTISNASTTYAGIIGGTGGLTLTAGTQTLSGANTYSGATTINGGTLQAGATNTFSSASAHAVTGTLDLKDSTRRSVRSPAPEP
jgi:fibronectin-binding autotransporter adhesin